MLLRLLWVGNLTILGLRWRTKLVNDSEHWSPSVSNTDHEDNGLTFLHFLIMHVFSYYGFYPWLTNNQRQGEDVVVGLKPLIGRCLTFVRVLYDRNFFLLPYFPFFSLLFPLSLPFSVFKNFYENQDQMSGGVIKFI